MTPTPSPPHRPGATYEFWHARSQRGESLRTGPVISPAHQELPFDFAALETSGDEEHGVAGGSGGAGERADDVEDEEEEEGADGDEEEEEEEEEEEGGIEEVPMEIDVPFDAAAQGLKDIGSLASWTVSTCKPGNGVEALRDEDTNLFWQSDGPQPHFLNIHFSRLVSILSIRIYLDFDADESYTPTRITLLAGTGYHDLIPFHALNFEQPRGWIDVPLDHVGGGEDGKTLRAFLLQVKIVENHQNGKDTHVRGLKVYARDEKLRGVGVLEGLDAEKLNNAGPRKKRAEKKGGEKGWLAEPDWMRDPGLR